MLPSVDLLLQEHAYLAHHLDVIGAAEAEISTFLAKQRTVWISLSVKSGTMVLMAANAASS